MNKSAFENRISNLWSSFKRYNPIYFEGFIISFIITLLFFPLEILSHSVYGHDFPIYMLSLFSVLLVSFFTKGFIYSFLSAIIGIILASIPLTENKAQFFGIETGVLILLLLCVSLLSAAFISVYRERADFRNGRKKQNRQLSLFRSIGHDLRTPLTTIIGTSEVLSLDIDNLSKEKQLELLSSIKNDAVWLLKVVENLLLVTKLDNPEYIANIRSEVVEEIITETASLFKQRCSSVDLKVSIPEEIIVANLDATLIEQALLNLMDNSVVHGKTTTEIMLSLTKEGTNAVFTVSDNGIGLPENQNEIFNTYYTNNDSKRNVGLGLSIAKTVAQVHNGTITCRNNNNGGACFKLSIPAIELSDM